MPNKPRIIKPSWVPVHKREAFQNLNKDKNRKVYNSRKWRAFSKNYKERNPLCIKCKEKGIIKASAVTDHIQRVNVGGDIYDESNLQPLCKSCHNSKSGKEAHGYQEKPRK
ncbi:HNH endonuclease [Christiangramia marina]|uniref:HNH endonuclease n=1 Tax=Christiangramia marina TaxID=409436 RepID=UPI003AA80740